MSANLLERVNPKWLPLRPEEGFLSFLARVRLALCMPHPEGEATAELIALAYDHALWNAACAKESAVVMNAEGFGSIDVRVWVALHGGTEQWHRFDAGRDAFGCIALTTELRAALRRAIGIEAQP